MRLFQGITRRLLRSRVVKRLAAPDNAGSIPVAVRPITLTHTRQVRHFTLLAILNVARAVRNSDRSWPGKSARDRGAHNSRLASCARSINPLPYLGKRRVSSTPLPQSRTHIHRPASPRHTEVHSPWPGSTIPPYIGR